MRRMLPTGFWQSLRSLHNGRMPIPDIHSESFGGTPRVFFLQARIGECIHGIGAVEHLGQTFST